MNSIYSILFLFLISSINSFNVDSCGTTSNTYYSLDFSSTYYKSDITLDWTSDDDVDVNIPFVELSDGATNFQPLFINATFVKFAETGYDGDYSNGMVINNDQYNILIADQFQGSYNFTKEITDYIVKDNILKTNVKAVSFGANPNSVSEVYKHYFAWIECAGEKKARLRYSDIMVSVNNGKFYEISKYLLIVIAALLF